MALLSQTSADKSIPQTMIDNILTECLSETVGSMFGSVFDHPFLSIDAITVSDVVKPIPVKWAEDIQIDIQIDNDQFGGLERESGLPASLASGRGGGSTWNKEMGNRRLREALQRLDLPEDPSVSITNIESWSKFDLEKEKKRVKHELKRYDAVFRQQFMRLPSRLEKEPMRPLYTYYRVLKNTIAGRGGVVGKDDDDDDENAAGNLGGAAQGQGPLGVGRRRSGRDSLDYGRGSIQRSSVGSVPEEMDEHLPDTNGEGGQVNEREIIEQRLASLAQEKIVVRNKLQAYQEKFFRENNRKIRFHRDILPIEREYRTYKHLKEEIAKFEKQIKDLS